MFLILFFKLLLKNLIPRKKKKKKKQKTKMKDKNIVGINDDDELYQYGKKVLGEEYEIIVQKFVNIEDFPNPFDFYSFRKRYLRLIQEILQCPEVLENDKDIFMTLLQSGPHSWSKYWTLDFSINSDNEKELREGQFACHNCLKNDVYAYNTSHQELQTRSADESTTIFVTCHTCNRRFRISS